MGNSYIFHAPVVASDSCMHAYRIVLRPMKLAVFAEFLSICF